MSRAVVLFSGGQDSTTCLFLAKSQHEHVTAVSIRYGQRHAAEIEAAAKIAALAGADHVILDVPAIAQIGDSALVGASAIAGDGGRQDDGVPNGLPTSFVPMRNAILLSLAAAVAVKVGAHVLYTGVCQTDYSGYPDCRQGFIESLNDAFCEGLPSSTPLSIVTPLMKLTKAETVQLAASLPGCLDALALSVTCYEGARPGCGACPACTLRARGFTEAGVTDPAEVRA